MSVEVDGGGFPIFKSYHDYRLKPRQVGRSVSDAVQFREAFQDFKNALAVDARWTSRFSRSQVTAIQRAIATNYPRIDGFTWHHHQDGGGDLLQLVDRRAHRSKGHYGGRFLSGGRP
jgi:filamentous hemagglutinin